MNIVLTEGEYKQLVPMTERDDLRAVVDALGVSLLAATGQVCIYSASPKAFEFCDQCPLGTARNRNRDGHEHLAELYCTKDQRYGT